MKLLFRKQLGALRPVDTEGEEALHKIANGTLVTVEMKRGRNLPHMRLFMALLHLVHDNQDRYDSFNSFRAAFTIALGHYDSVVLPDGSVAVTPKSISFANMDQTEFDVFFNDAVDLICRRWLPTVGSEALTREVHEMVGIAA